ncbi:g8447 [Coccomyxa elongata]
MSTQSCPDLEALEEVKNQILGFKNWDDSKKGRALNRLKGEDLERFSGLPDDVLQATLDVELSAGLTLREAVACPLPLLEQRHSPRKSRTKTQPRKPRTFSDVLPWEGFLHRSRDLFNSLDNTERVYRQPVMVSDIRPGHSYKPAADEAEVRGCLVYMMFTSINTTARILGIAMNFCSGGSERSMSFTDLLVRPAGAQSNPNSLSSQVFGVIEVKGDWEFQLERGERLEEALHDPNRSGEIVQAIQQVLAGGGGGGGGARAGGGGGGGGGGRRAFPFPTGNS